ncbi:hypothetical protein YPPY47_2345, partial [Yersinia pestis PY-47]|jgi:hypothetical protein
MD